MYTLLRNDKPKKYHICWKIGAGTIFQNLLSFCLYNIVEVTKNEKELPNIFGAFP